MAVVMNSRDRGGAGRPPERNTDRTAAERAARTGGGPRAPRRGPTSPRARPGRARGAATETSHDHHEPMTQDAILTDRDHRCRRARAPGAGRSALAGTLPRIGIILIIFAAGWLSVTAVQSLQGIVGPLLLTLNLAIVAYPVQGARHYGIPKIIGACVSGAIIFAIVLAFFRALGWSLTMLIQEIPGTEAVHRHLPPDHRPAEQIRDQRDPGDAAAAKPARPPGSSASRRRRSAASPARSRSCSSR